MRITFEVESKDETGLSPVALGHSFRDLLIALDSLPVEIQVTVSKYDPPAPNTLEWLRSALKPSAYDVTPGDEPMLVKSFLASNGLIFSPIVDGKDSLCGLQIKHEASGSCFALPLVTTKAVAHYLMALCEVPWKFHSSRPSEKEPSTLVSGRPKA